MSVKTLVALLTAAAVLLTVSLPASAGRMSPVGSYKYIRSNSAVTGGCLPGRGSQGVVVIKRNPTGGGYDLHFLHPCRPPAICLLRGKCQGNDCRFGAVILKDPVKSLGYRSYTLILKFAHGDAVGRGRIEHKYPPLHCFWDHLIALKNLRGPHRKPK
jgi:hypothetical protein